MNFCKIHVEMEIMTQALQPSYLSQVRKLRQMAEQVVKSYPIQNPQIQFIHHGENTTFKVSSTKKSYLLRLHRPGYHSQKALLEELNWLKQLAQTTDIPVQKPLLSQRHKLVEKAEIEGLPARYCSMMQWQEGRVRFKNHSVQSMKQLGTLIAQLHHSSKNIKVMERNYWDAEGIIGKRAKLGSILELKKVLKKKDYEILSQCQQWVYKKILHFEKNHPDQLALIHADLHFGNVLWGPGELFPIDFDDCGRGFYLFDLAIPLLSIKRFESHYGKSKTGSLRDALLKGYTDSNALSDKQQEMLPYFLLARNMTLLSWYYLRSDIPRIRKYFTYIAPKQIQACKRALNYGPGSI